jgi:hypothetical protein
MPDTLPDIEVVGQRRKPNGTFPQRGGGSGGGGLGNEGGEHQNEVGENDPPPDQIDPCADPETALPWNADAAGAAAVPKFLLKAAEIGFADAPNGVPTLLNREYGSFLVRGSGQSLETNQVTPGDVRDQTNPNWVSTLTIDPTGVTVANYQGDVHSHPNGNELPSPADWDGFMANNRAARESGRTGETFYMYIIAVSQNGGPPTVRVYQDGPRAANSPDPARPTEVGPEVNPDAQPC